MLSAYRENRHVVKTNRFDGFMSNFIQIVRLLEGIAPPSRASLRWLSFCSKICAALTTRDDFLIFRCAWMRAPSRVLSQPEPA